MTNTGSKILIMAGGTGGHIFPALAVARELQFRGHQVEWLGSRTGMENKLVVDAGIPLHRISVSGIAGKKLLKLVMAPFMITTATLQALGVLRRVKPDCVLGLGGFVTGPGGVAAWLTGRPLLIHEQNAIPGISNRILAHIACRVMETFPGTFKAARNVLYTGNPVRQEILALHGKAGKSPLDGRPLQLLVLGGSQGAQSINAVIPDILARFEPARRPRILHQTGAANLESTRSAYLSSGLNTDDGIEIRGFIDDMAAAFAWADLVIARSGASTVCELAVAGLPAILVPYPWHRDQQQLHNAQWMVKAGAAILLEQKDLNVETLAAAIMNLDTNKKQLVEMTACARDLAIIDATQRIATQCLEAAHG